MEMDKLDTNNRYYIDKYYLIHPLSLVDSVKYKLCFYHKKKKIIKFNLISKQNYEIYGIIKKRYDFDFIIENESGKILINYNEVDPETIFPIGFNPIKFYERIQISEEQRERIYKRDNYTCRYKFEGCNQDFQIDHIIPVSLGGLNVDENLVTCCSNCNLKKGNKVIYPKS